MTPQSQHKPDVYDIVNDRIIASLEEGHIPWKQPWKESGPPRNLISNREYRGFNLLLLNSLCYPQNLFVTLRQVNELGAKVKKGEHGTPVIFWTKKDDEEPKEGEEKKRTKTILRYYTVFNIDQCIDIPKDRIPSLEVFHNDPIKSCEEIVENMPQRPTITHKAQRAYYDPEKDTVNMPKLKSFIDSESYYDTLFHELVHSTGHKSRLDRPTVMNTDYDEAMYSEEELIAEIGACFLNSIAGSPGTHFENNVAYIEGWLKKLRGDRRFIVFASAKAQKAVDFIVPRVFSDAGDHESAEMVEA